MGGKHKVANRTKNNARPSSSGRTAELLGASMPQFVGFTGLKDSGFGFSLTSTDELDAALDSNFQLVIKKISKKDATTKLKGLQEFAELVKSAEIETLKSVLPVWPRFYNVLATDTDNRVREATHNVHHQIVLKAKRNIAPFLKQIMAPWFTSQYDTYAPAATIASQAFKDAFPSNKFQEAIVFCQEEILTYIKDNLIEQTAQTSAGKSMTAEDAEAKYERVVTSCLQGYYLYLTKVPSVQIEKVAALNNDIVSSNKFWKLAKHKVSQIRAAWFEVLTALCQNALFLLDGKGSTITTIVFNTIDETDPTVLPYVWESALLIMSSVKEWWSYINLEKLFIPKLSKILKQGGQGTAAVIYPNLLPLISHLPPVLDAPTFYNTFFENLRLGFKQKNVIASRSESVAVATALVECLQYTIMKNRNDINLCKHLIKDHIISTIEWCLLENQVCHKTVFNQISPLVQYWNRNIDQPQMENYAKYLDFFFECINELFKETLFNLKGIRPLNVSEVATKQIELLQCLKHISKSKKQCKVKFSETTDIDTHLDDISSLSIIESEMYLKKLGFVVYAISQEYVKYIEEHKSKELLKHFYSLVLEFDTENFYHNLTESMKQKNPEFKLIDIFNELLYKWLQSKELCSQNIVDLIFLLFNYVDESDQEVIVGTISKINQGDCLGWCITRALSHPYNKNIIIKEWLKNDKVGKFIVSIAEKEINDKSDPELSVLFKLALTENETGELLIQKEAVTEILEKLINVLENENNYILTFDSCSSLASYMSAIVYTENLLLNYGDTLLLSLFKLSCTNNFDPEIMSAETVYEVNSAWEDAVTLLSSGISKEEFLALTTKFADVIEAEFSNSDFSQGNICHLTDIVVNYLKACFKSVHYLNEILNIFVQRSFTLVQKNNLTHICKVAEYIKGNLCSPYQELEGIEDDINEINIFKYFVWTYFRVNIISKNLVSNEDNSEESDDEEEKEFRSVLSFIENREEFLSDILYDLTLSKSFLENYKNVKYYKETLIYNNLVKNQFKSFIEKLSNFDTNKLKDFLKEKIQTESWLWCISVSILFTDIIPSSSCKIYEEISSGIKDNNLSVLHLTQTFGQYLNYDYVQHNLGFIENIIILRHLLHTNDIDVQIAEVFGQIDNLRCENVSKFLFNSSNIGWKDTQEIIEIIRLCSGLIREKISSLTRRHWDFGVLSLVSWSANSLKVKSQYEKIQVQALFTAVMNLYNSIEDQITVLKKEQLKNNFVDEWEDVLVESIHSDFVQLWLYLADQLDSIEYQRVLKHTPLIQQFGTMIDLIRYNYIFKFNGNPLPKWTKFLKKSCSLLVNPLPTLQIWGYKMLMKLVPGLVNIDSEAVNTNTPHQKGLIFEQFKDILVKTHEIVNSMLMDFKLGEDSCSVKPSTDSFTYSLAYLLLWDVLLTLCEQSSTELRYQYADWLRNQDLLKNFLNNLFRLMPTEVLHFNEGKAKSLLEHFFQKPNLEVKDHCDNEKIEKLVCWLYASALCQLPALVRQWWAGLETRVAQVVEKVTTVYVSPQLCNNELTDVTQHQTKFKNMVIKVVPSVREIIAVYTVDEAHMELVISLPANYPLSGPEVQCNRQIGGTTHKQWLLQFKKCVLHQNGRIWDGLSIWNNNLDKKFDGVEECYICFAVLHPGTYQLPKLSCQTCKKKFHSACLYKWFSTSNKSSCPICRNLF